MAKAYGFRLVWGTEVNSRVAHLAALQLTGKPNIGCLLYDGGRLPLKSDSFPVVASGHVIEHTVDPAAYLNEHLRVLESKGLLFLEFPDRYNLTELHTGAVSLEWAPRPVRDLLYLYLGSRVSLLPAAEREKYNSIRKTLQPIGVSTIRRILSSGPYHDSKIMHMYRPTRGFVRLIVQKG